MEFNFSEEQRLLKDSANSFLEEFSSSERIREAMQSELGFNQEAVSYTHLRAHET